MSDFYEECAAEWLSMANRLEGDGRDAYKELVSEVLTLARLSSHPGQQ
jgi:hypothetical protein